MAGLSIVAGGDEGARDEFVRAHPRGTIFHLAGWGRAVERVFKHERRDLVARRDGEVVGVLPLCRVRSLLFGHRLLSVPFGVYGGPLSGDEEAGVALREEAQELAERLEVGHLELRCREEGPADWPGTDLYVTFRGDLGPSPEEILAARPKETRRTIRVGLREGFVPVEGWETFDDFYRLFARSHRDHGTPVLPRRWLRVLAEELPGCCELQCLRDGAGGAVVAGVVVLTFGDEVMPYYVGASREVYRRHVNDVLYHQVMCRAAERGARTFDFGRSKRGTGSRDYKHRWGFTEFPLDYRFHLVRDREVPALNPLNPRYARRIALWRRLPLCLANRLGPKIVRGLP